MMLKQINKLISLNFNMDTYISNSIFAGTIITNLINELLDQAKLDKSTFELVSEEFNLYEVIIQTF